MLGAAKLNSKSTAQTHYIHHLAIMAEQQVNLTDLDLNQLQDVKKQLDSVSPRIEFPVKCTNG
jgi:hypothetical protein